MVEVKEFIIKNENAKIKYGIIGFPWDMGASLGRPGARYAPKTIRESLKWILHRIQDNRVYDIEGKALVDFSEIEIVDFGDIPIVAYDALRTFENAYQIVKEVLKKDIKPVILGGDHSISYPCIKALHDTSLGNIGIIQFDAHLDLVDENPVQGKYSHSSEIRRAIELERVDPKNIVQIGVRGYNYPYHYHEVKEFGITQFTPDDVRRSGSEKLIEEVLEIVKRCEKLYLTLDIDVVDPAFAPGSGADEPGGLASWELLDIIRRLAPHVDVMDIVEVNPLFDVHNMTAAVAARALFDFIVYNSKGV